MAANNKTQMVLSHDNSIIESNGYQPPLTTALVRLFAELPVRNRVPDCS